MNTSVQTSVVVDVPVQRAFRVFTEEMGTWWNPDHHIIDAPLAEMVVEPYVGGNIYDRGTDGSECRWARVLTYEPPSLFVFSWDINHLTWQVETDQSRCSEVAVSFAAVDGGTLVTLEHRHLDRHGEGWEAMAQAVGSGWDLSRFAAAALATVGGPR